MSLTAAIRTAQGALHTTSAQTAITSRNVAGASDPGYSRKIALVTTSANGSQTLAITRAANEALYRSMIEATSGAAARQALADGLDRLDQTIGDPQDGRSPAALIGALNDSIQTYSALPSNVSLAQDVIARARDLAGALNDASTTVGDVRRQADRDMASAVGALNDLLAAFKSANDAVVIGTHAGAPDITDKLDARDRILSQISEIIGVRTVSRGANDVALYTDGGVTLFDGIPRAVSFAASPALGAGQAGNAVHVDGVPVTGASASMPIKSGSLQGFAALRDEVTVTYQNQLDEIARALIATFAESDQSVPASLPDRPGLFTWSGDPAIPPSPTAGLAGDIAINANVDPAQGGSLSRLRDGGISDPGNPAYVYNGEGAASFSGRLAELLGRLQGATTFDPAAGLESGSTLGTFAANSVGWLAAMRQDATSDAAYQAALVSRASDALSNATGVNLDDEMSLLLELERSFQASSKLLATIDDMLAGFIAGIGR